MLMARNEGKGGKSEGHDNKGVVEGRQHQQKEQWQQQQGWWATKRALATEMQLRQGQGWQASKRAMTRVARVMVIAMVTKRSMAINHNNTDNGESKEWLRASDGGNNGDGEGDGTKGMAAHAITGERGMIVAMGNGLCVFLCE